MDKKFKISRRDIILSVLFSVVYLCCIFAVPIRSVSIIGIPIFLLLMIHEVHGLYLEVYLSDDEIMIKRFFLGEGITVLRYRYENITYSYRKALQGRGTLAMQLFIYDSDIEVLRMQNVSMGWNNDIILEIVSCLKEQNIKIAEGYKT